MNITIYLDDQTITPASLDSAVGINNLKVSDIIKIEQNDIATIESIIDYYSQRYTFAINFLQMIRRAFYTKRFDEARIATQNFKQVIAETSNLLRKIAVSEPEMKDNPRKAQQAMQIIQQETQTFDKLNLFFSGYEKKEQTYRKKKITIVYEDLNLVMQEINQQLATGNQRVVSADAESTNTQNSISAIEDIRPSDL